MPTISKERGSLNTKKDRLWLESCLQALSRALNSQNEEDYSAHLRASLRQAAISDLIRKIPILHQAEREMLSHQGRTDSSGDSEELLPKLLYTGELEVSNELLRRLREICFVRERKAEEVQLLTDITNSIISSLDMKKIFSVITTKIRRLVDFDRASIVLVDEMQDKVLAFVLVTKSDSNYREGVYPLKGTAQEWVLKYRKSCIDNNLKNQWFRENWGLYVEGLRSSIRVPLFLRGKVVGTLNLDSRREGAYTTAEQRLLEQVAGQIAIAVENSRLYEEALRRSEQIAAINYSLERTVQEKTAKIRELEKKRAILNGLIAHSLKNPIIGLRQALQMLAIENERFEREALKDLLDELCSNCDLLLGIVNDMLDVYRYEFDSIPLYLEPVDVSDPLYDGLRLLRYSIAEKAVDVVTRTGSKLIVNGDRKRLCRVFLNLLENAVRFSPPGASIMVSASLAMKDGGSFAQVTIEDEGPGIPEKDLPRIFDQFYQVERKDFSVEAGSGLGLCYCKMVIEAHGGAIWAENRNVGGAALRILLPILDDAALLWRDW